MIRRPPRSTLSSSSAASDVYKRQVGLFGGGLGLGFGLAHLGVRWRAPAADPLLVPLAALLNGVGMALIYRLDIAYAAQALQHPAPRGAASLQLVWTGIGLLLFS